MVKHLLFSQIMNLLSKMMKPFQEQVDSNLFQMLSILLWQNVAEELELLNHHQLLENLPQGRIQK
jgi:hypothetical protein